MKLHYGELFIYFSVWIFVNLLALYKLFTAQSGLPALYTCYLALFMLFTAQSEIFENDPSLLNSMRDLESGWSFTSRLRDVSDIEWSSWKYLFRISWFYLIAQFIVSEIIRKFSKHLLKYWYIMSSVIFLLLYMGIRQFMIISAQPILYAAITFSGGKKTSVWIASVVLLLSYNSLKYKYFFWYFLDHEGLEDEKIYLIIFGVAWIELRCISFSIDYIEKMNKLHSIEQKEKYEHCSLLENVINMFSYVLYLPLLYTGPVILYEDFEKSFTMPYEKLSLRLKRFTLDMSLFLVYTFLLDLALHYIYFFAMQSNMESVRRLPSIAYCAGGLWMGLEFHMKYVISYGTTGAFSKLDNFEPPPTPRCIVRVHVYSQMWRYFDVGLYRFLVKYVYKPSYDMLSSCSKLPKIVHKLLASLSTFIFIFLWHGISWHIFVWTVLNYIGIVLENMSKLLSQSKQYKWFRQNVLKTVAMETRLIAMLCTPLLTMSAISNFYLFGGTEVGDLYVESFVNPSLWNSLLVFGCFYCCCHVSMALEDVPSRTTMRRLEPKDVNS